MHIQNNYFSARFLSSIPTTHHLTNFKTNMEVAFVGYSNSGKSSTINALTCHKNLAKVSKNPGSTKLINLFEIQPNIFFIDFPGYGYSNNIKKQNNYWYSIVHKYLKKSQNLRGLIITTDIRHVIKYLDQKIIQYALILHIPIIVLLNKSDKVSKNTAYNILYKIKKKFIHKNTIPHQYITIKIFSAIKIQKITSITRILNYWLT